ncbi:MAG: dihydrolipoyl dehydrogenase [Bacteroidales bacterium]|nr:dihydrolipoyl dehydrogenase [Bacteroidales bacterium]
MKLLIIGAGPGGYETALAAAKRGVEVVLVEAGPVGGTCLNEGCIPTKSFCKNAQLLEQLREAEAFGVSDLAYNFDFKAVTARKNAVVEQLRGGVESLLSHKLITLVRGKASFKDPHTVTVGDEEYSADYIIIATGSVSASLPVPGADLEGILTSKEILDIEELPKKLCVIGGGVIGLEFASIFNSFSCEVTVLEYCKEILPRFDTDLAKRLKQCLGKKGIDINTQSQVLSISKEEEQYKVTFLRKGKEESVVADKVLMAVGRKANVDSLNLSEAGVEFGPRGIVVNEVMQTSQPHIYAVGDINGKMMLAHAAIFQGLVALDHMMGVDNDIDLSVMPAAVFTSPEAASVGKTEDECKEAGIKVKCLKSFFRANGKAVTMGETEGFCKVIVEEETGLLLGCHLFGPHSSDIVQEVCALISRKSTLKQLQDIIHTHPTLTEVIQSAAHQ